MSSVSFATVWLVFRKELLDVSRDRRALLLMLGLPLVLYPLLIVGFHYALLIQLQVLEKKTSLVWVAKPEALPAALRLQLEKDERRLRVEAEPAGVDEAAALARGDVRAILKAPGDLEDQIARVTTSVPVEVVFTSGLDPSTEARKKVFESLHDWREEILRDRLRAKGLEPAFVEPLALASRDVAPRGAILGRLLAFMLVITSLLGASYPAIDLAAGEKERGTLETLLLAPAQRIEIALGKFLAVALVALGCSLVNLASLGFTFTHFMSLASSGELVEHLGAVSFSAAVAVPMAIALVPLTALFSALSLALATNATSYKEATSYVQPLAVVAIFLAMASALPGVELTPGAACIPIAGIALLFRDLLGGTAQPGCAALAIASAAVYAGLAIRWVTHLYDQEEVLARPATALGIELLARRRPGDARPPVPTAAQAVAASILAILLLWFLSDTLQGRGHLLRGAALTLVLLIAVPPLALAAWLRLDLRETFRLRPAPARALESALLIALGSPILGRDVAHLQTTITSDALPSLEEASRRLLEVLASYPPAVSLLVIGLVPAVCEELLFRGFVLSGLATRMRPPRAAILAALLFALAHLEPAGLGARTLLGTVFGLLALRSASLAPSVLGHFVHNGLVLAIGVREHVLEEHGLLVGGFASWPLRLAALASVAAGLALLRGVRPAAAT